MTLRYLNYIVRKTFNLGLKHRMKCFSFAYLAEMLSVRILKKETFETLDYFSCNYLCAHLKVSVLLKGL